MVLKKGPQKRHSFISWLPRVVVHKLTPFGVPAITLIKRRYFRFQRLLKNYGKVLELLADASEKQGGGFVLDKQYLVALTNKLFDLADSIVYDLNVLTRQQHITFFDLLDRFKKETKEIISGRPPFFQSEQVISFSNAKEFVPQHVGNKNASLINLHHRMGVPVPEGFAITYTAYQRLIEGNNLGDLIEQAVDKFRRNDPYATKELLALQNRIRSATIPLDLREKVHDALHALTEKFGNDLSLTIDFTILGKNLDTAAKATDDYTKTVSNVKPDAVLDVYLEEISKLYDPAQVCLRQMKRMGEAAFLAAVCKRMIAGKARGKLYTLDPASPNSGFMLLTTSSDRGNQGDLGRTYKISRNPPFEILSYENHHPVHQSAQENEGHILNCEEITGLIELAFRIERYLKQAQEIEWIQDIGGRFIITQTQRLSKTSITDIGRKDLANILKKHRVICEGVGKVVCRGVACGSVFLVHNESDLKKIPERGVLVSTNPHPWGAQSQIFQKAVAMLTDEKKPTGPLVSLARHFRIPFITGLGEVAKHLSPGTLITVDADENIVYEGRVEELVNYHLVEGLGYEDEPEYQLFQIIQDKIAPLILENVAQPECTINDCQTLHDLIHLAHANAVKSLLDEDSSRKELTWMSKRLGINPNLIFQFIDLGEGLKSEKLSKSVIDLKDIQSRPMIALGESFCAHGFRGDPIPRKRMVADSFPITDDELSNRRNVAVVSREYVNLIMERGGELDMVDAYLCEEAELNYIFCRFSKVSDEDYSCFLAYKVMQGLDFEVQETSKSLHAWISRLSPQDTEERLRIIGHLIIFIRISEERGYGDRSPEEVTKLFFQRCNLGNAI